jgi:hypothetical protein
MRVVAQLVELAQLREVSLEIVEEVTGDGTIGPYGAEPRRGGQGLGHGIKQRSERGRGKWWTPDAAGFVTAPRGISPDGISPRGRSCPWATRF